MKAQVGYSGKSGRGHVSTIGLMVTILEYRDAPRIFVGGRVNPPRNEHEQHDLVCDCRACRLGTVSVDRHMLLAPGRR